jgi:hypothetical protein
MHHFCFTLIILWKYYKYRISIFCNNIYNFIYMNQINKQNVISGSLNKRAKMALNRSPDSSNVSKKLPRQAFWSSFMTGESKMCLLEYYQGYSIFNSCDLVFHPRLPMFEFIRQASWQSLMMIEAKVWPLVLTNKCGRTTSIQRFIKIHNWVLEYTIDWLNIFSDQLNDIRLISNIIQNITRQNFYIT